MESNTAENLDLLNKLNSHILLKDISSQHIESLIPYCQTENWTNNSRFIDKNKSSKNFYFIIKGKIKVFSLNNETDRRFTLFLLTKNDVFDVFMLFNNLQHNLYYQSLEDTELVVVSNSYMRTWINDTPNALNSFFYYTLKHYELLESQAIDLSLNDISIRLAKLFLHNYNIITQKVELIDGLNHDEIAQLIGTTRAVLNLNIQNFKDDGIIIVGWKHIEIINYQLLLKKCHLSNSSN